MPKPIDMLNQKYGRLTVLEPAPKCANGQLHYICKCDCGKIITARGAHLRHGRSKSCGCLRQEITSQHRGTHRMTKTPLYRVWRGILDRCYYTSCRAYPHYGGRGIAVCSQWRHNFEQFHADMHSGYTAGLTIDRIDNDGDYTPENCRWTDITNQARNRRNNRKLHYAGRNRSLAEIAEITGVTYSLLQQRLTRGWALDEAINSPAGTWRKKIPGE